MKVKEFVANAGTFSRKYRIAERDNFHLSDIRPGDTGDLDSEDKPKAKDALKTGVEALAEMQEILYAQDRWSVLLLFQAMDAAGKDSAIKHVLSGINPQGCEVVSFKRPTEEELDHDYLWRCVKRLPERGRIGIFNRSYYEEVLVVRVHPEILSAQKIPKKLVTPKIWEERFEDIRSLERYLARNGVAICKFFLHVSRDEQRRRFLDRIDDEDKNWKFEANDVRERGHWDEYMRAYEDMIRETAAEHAPWYVVPADNKWFTRVVVAAAIIDTLDSLNLTYPALDAQEREALKAARNALAGEV
jgi:PPK2 family polyphosphate:nucleotide phosphotransferase